MELKFPFKNVTFNTLLDFFQEGKVKDFSDIKNNKDSWRKSLFYDSIQHWRDLLPDFENEILQIITTSSQNTIDTYFNLLIEHLKVFSENLTKDYFQKKISSWNDDISRKHSAALENAKEERIKKENHRMQRIDESNNLDIGSIIDSYLTIKNIENLDKKIDLIDESIIDEYVETILPLSNELQELSGKYIKLWSEGKIKSKIEELNTPKPVVFVEGEHDITYLKKAAEFLHKEELLNQIVIRQRGGFAKLDRLWEILNEQSWETIPQIKIFLYDCDTNKKDEDLANHFKRVIPTQPNTIIKKGIENLFENSIVDKAIEFKKAFIDFKKTSGTRRGIDYIEVLNEVNKDEKKNFCEWICNNAQSSDFGNFNILFEIIENIIYQNNNR